MARPIEFEKDVVLRKSMKVFWQRGYKATSIQDIIRATNVQPGSIYGTFGNKQKLFIASLECYFSDMKKLVRKTLYSDQPPLECINNFFIGITEHAKQNDIENGCLLVNTLSELPTIDQETSGIVCEMLSQLEASFVEVLEKAKKQDEISSDKNPEQLAKMLISGMYGLRTYSKADPSHQSQSIIIEGLMSTLKH